MAKKTPFICPVCEGKRMVGPRFYSPFDNGATSCRSCDGTGVVWSPDEPIIVKAQPRPVESFEEFKKAVEDFQKLQELQEDPITKIKKQIPQVTEVRVIKSITSCTCPNLDDYNGIYIGDSFCKVHNTTIITDC